MIEEIADVLAVCPNCNTALAMAKEPPYISDCYRLYCVRESCDFNSIVVHAVTASLAHRKAAELLHQLPESKAERVGVKQFTDVEGSPITLTPYEFGEADGIGITVNDPEATTECIITDPATVRGIRDWLDSWLSLHDPSYTEPEPQTSGVSPETISAMADEIGKHRSRMAKMQECLDALEAWKADHDDTHLNHLSDTLRQLADKVSALEAERQTPPAAQPEPPKAAARDCITDFVEIIERAKKEQRVFRFGEHDVSIPGPLFSNPPAIATLRDYLTRWLQVVEYEQDPSIDASEHILHQDDPAAVCSCGGGVVVVEDGGKHTAMCTHCPGKTQPALTRSAALRMWKAGKWNKESKVDSYRCAVCHQRVYDTFGDGFLCPACADDKSAAS